MRAILLVGGEGTRLRPLTFNTPKQLVPVLNRPLLSHLLRHLREAGVTEIALAGAAAGDVIEEALGDGRALGVELRYVNEETPLGSGGAIASIAAGWDDPFFVINGDIITDLDIGALIAFHEAREAELTIGLSEVEDPSEFGVVALDHADRITRFVEKPPAASAPSRWINAGIWLFARPLLGAEAATSFSRVEETLFPALAAEGRSIYGFRHEGYWLDVGSVAAYRRANMDAVAGVGPCRRDLEWPLSDFLLMGARVEPGAHLEGPLLVGAGSVIEAGAVARGPAVIGRDCEIGGGAEIRDSVLWDGVRVEAAARVDGCVLANDAVVGSAASLTDTVIPHNSTVPAAAGPASGIRPDPGRRDV